MPIAGGRWGGRACRLATQLVPLLEVLRLSHPGRIGGDDLSRKDGEEASASHHTVLCHAVGSTTYLHDQKDVTMNTRREVLRCASLRCDREARYLVSAQAPRETEPPR